MIKLSSPENEVELLILKSIFDSEEVNYYVLNDYFGSIKVGSNNEMNEANFMFASLY